MSMLEILDAAVEDRVLVFGSLPPGGRDLDLLARPTELRAIAAKLAEAGYLHRGACWADFHDYRADAIELVPIEDWNLPAEEAEALFAEARPLEGLGRFVRPAPHHVLLIAARKLVRSGTASDKERRKLQAAAEEDERCWSLAREHAQAWRASAALELLRQAYESGAPVGRVARARAAARERDHRRAGALPRYVRAYLAVAPRPRRGAVVSLSGCDGAGKSSQARALQQALAGVGVDAVVVWGPLGRFRVLDAVALPIKTLVRLTRDGAAPETAGARALGAVMSNRTESTHPAGRLLKQLWVTGVAALNGCSQRRAALPHLLRGRVVIFDRSALDAFVLIRFLYGEGHEFGLQRWLLRALAPSSARGYFLDVSPETLLERKRDWWTASDLGRQARVYREEHGRFRTRRLDGELPRDELCAEIARDVWLAVSARGRNSA